jgi:hypothetical protein
MKDMMDRPRYVVRSRQSIEDLERRGLVSVRYGCECIQDREPGFHVHSGVMVHVRFLCDGVCAVVPKNYLRRAQ